MRLLNNYVDPKSFWDLNPLLKLHPTLKEVYEQDKSRNKQDSSRLCYGLAILVDQSEENKFRNYPEEDKKFLIAEQLFGNKDFDWSTPEVVKLIEVFDDMLLSPAKRSLRNWKIKLEERDAFLGATKYSLQNAAELDKILAQTDKLYSQYERVLKALEADKQEPSARGAKQLSLSDQNKI